MGTGRAQREPRKTAGLSRFWRTSALFGLLPAGGTKSRGPSGGFNHRRAEPSRPSTRPSRPRDSRTLRAFTAASTDSPTLRTPNRETGPPRLGAQSREVRFSFFLLPNWTLECELAQRTLDQRLEMSLQSLFLPLKCFPVNTFTHPTPARPGENQRTPKDEEKSCILSVL